MKSLYMNPQKQAKKPIIVKKYLAYKKPFKPESDFLILSEKRTK